MSMMKTGVIVLVMAVISIVNTALLHAASFNIASGETFDLKTSTATLSDKNIDNAGTLQLSTGTLKGGGNWSNTGTFLTNTGTVEFTGTTSQAISGNNSFYNLTCTSTAINPSNWTDSGNNTNWKTAGATTTTTAAPATTTTTTSSTTTTTKPSSTTTTTAQGATTTTTSTTTTTVGATTTLIGGTTPIPPTTPVPGMATPRPEPTLPGNATPEPTLTSRPTPEPGGTPPPRPTSTPLSGAATPKPRPSSTAVAQGTIAGTVSDTLTSKGIANATLSDDTGESAETDNTGSYQLEVEAGNYTLTATADGYESSSQSASSRAGLTTELNFQLSKPSSEVFGFVTDEDDNELIGASMTLQNADFSDNFVTDEDGYYEFTQLASGDYTLTSEMDGYQTQSLNINVRAHEQLEMETIALEENYRGKIYGYAVDVHGETLSKVTIKLSGKGKTKTVNEKEKTDNDGYFEFKGLQKATYKLKGKKKRYKTGRKSVKLKEGEEKEIELLLKSKNGDND